ncbi:pilus assembly FimT family protein [Legionella sp. D16C41]|uniref:pilus assembly FimT family protein n=1 Tax=Legionella sp. D16C41 TaxID=3402688 RepID=UPI003AF90D5A
MIYKQGFTLIELLIVISIVSLLFLFSTSSDYQLYEKNQLQIISDKLKSAIRYGRYKALAQGTTLALVPLDNFNWSAGMVLFIDNKKHKPDKENIIRVWQQYTRTIKIDWQGFQSKHYLIFTPILKKAACNGHFTLSINNKIQKKIIVNRLCFTHEPVVKNS